MNCLQLSSIPQALPLAFFIISPQKATAIWRARTAKRYSHQHSTECVEAASPRGPRQELTFVAAGLGFLASLSKSDVAGPSLGKSTS